MRDDLVTRVVMWFHYCLALVFLALEMNPSGSDLSHVRMLILGCFWLLSAIFLHLRAAASRSERTSR